MSLAKSTQIATIVTAAIALMALFYTARVSNKTVKMIDSQSRPWVAPTGAFIHCDVDPIRIRVSFENAGALPAILRLENSISVGRATKNGEATHKAAIIMPGQSSATSFFVARKYYESIASGAVELVMRLRIIYTDDDGEPDKYHTIVTLKVDPTSLPDKLEPGLPPRQVIWTVESAEIR